MSKYMNKNKLRNLILTAKFKNNINVINLLILKTSILNSREVYSINVFPVFLNISNN